MLHLCRVNGWPEEPYTTGVALIPGEAVRRLTRHRIKKSAGITLDMVQGILDGYGYTRDFRASDEQWELAIGCAICVAFKVFGRWDDIAQLRWDDEFCEVYEECVRFYLEHRKNAMDKGNFVEIARPAVRS